MLYNQCPVNNSYQGMDGVNIPNEEKEIDLNELFRQHEAREVLPEAPFHPTNFHLVWKGNAKAKTKAGSQTSRSPNRRPRKPEVAKAAAKSRSPRRSTLRREVGKVSDSAHSSRVSWASIDRSMAAAQLRYGAEARPVVLPAAKQRDESARFDRSPAPGTYNLSAGTIAGTIESGAVRAPLLQGRRNPPLHANKDVPGPGTYISSASFTAFSVQSSAAPRFLGREGRPSLHVVDRGPGPGHYRTSNGMGLGKDRHIPTVSMLRAKPKHDAAKQLLGPGSYDQPASASFGFASSSTAAQAGSTSRGIGPAVTFSTTPRFSTIQHPSLGGLSSPPTDVRHPRLSAHPVHATLMRALRRRAVERKRQAQAVQGLSGEETAQAQAAHLEKFDATRGKMAQRAHAIRDKRRQQRTRQLESKREGIDATLDHQRQMDQIVNHKFYKSLQARRLQALTKARKQAIGWHFYVALASRTQAMQIAIQKDRTRRNLALLVQRAKGTIKRFCKRWRDKTKQKKEQRAARIIYRTLRRWFLRRTYERKQRAARVLLSTLRDIAVRNQVTAQIQALHAVVVPIQRAWRDFVRRREERLEEAEEAFRTEELALMNKYKETEGKKEFQRLKGRGQLKLHQMKNESSAMKKIVEEVKFHLVPEEMRKKLILNHYTYAKGLYKKDLSKWFNKTGKTWATANKGKEKKKGAQDITSLYTRPNFDYHPSQSNIFQLMGAGHLEMESPRVPLTMRDNIKRVMRTMVALSRSPRAQNAGTFTFK